MCERGHPASAADSVGPRYRRRSRSPRLYLFTRPLLTSCRLGKTDARVAPSEAQNLVHKVMQGDLVLLVRKVQLVHKVLLVHKVIKVQQVLKVHKELKVLLA